VLVAASDASLALPGLPVGLPCPVIGAQAREAELSDMLNSAQSSLQAMQRLYATAQNQLFEMQSMREEAAVGKQVCGHCFFVSVALLGLLCSLVCDLPILQLHVSCICLLHLRGQPVD